MALSPPPVSLLLRALFPPGAGGASPGGAGGLPIPGTGGAPPMAGALGPSLTLPTMGADRSLICVTFLSLAPLLMSPNSAPCDMSVVALWHADSHFTAVRLLSRRKRDILFLLPPAPLLPGLSFPALAGEVVALQRLVPWAAWAEGEVVRALCRVPRRVWGRSV